MDGMLSQDEINALLNGMDSGNISNASVPDTSSKADGSIDDSTLSDVEKDAIGEVANISMGTSATTLYSLVNRKVSITTPMVSLSTWDILSREYERPCVFIQIHYTNGLDGTNILVLKEKDVKIITDLMMGGDGTSIDGELGDLHLSAISEAMNQMMGSAATSLSSMLGQTIDISPPIATLVPVENSVAPDDVADFLKNTFVMISFRMQIGDLVDSTIMQLYPIDFAKSLVRNFMATQSFSEPEPELVVEQERKPSANEYEGNRSTQMGNSQMDNTQMGMQQMGMQQTGNSQMGMPQRGMPQMGAQQMGMPQMQNVNVQPAQFQNFSNTYDATFTQENIALIRDVPLEVTVELGRTIKSIAEILDFAPGTIIELDKIAGEPIDVLVNGKFVAKGEVVVIEESFGIRVTEIVK